MESGMGRSCAVLFCSGSVLCCAVLLCSGCFLRLPRREDTQCKETLFTCDHTSPYYYDTFMDWANSPMMGASP